MNGGAKSHREVRVTQTEESGQRCTFKHKGIVPAKVGLACGYHVAEVYDLLADILDLWDALPGADRPAPGGGPDDVRTKTPDPPAPLNLTRFAIRRQNGVRVVADRYGKYGLPMPPAIERTPQRNFNYISGELDSNGGDIPDVWAVLHAWCAEVAEERNTRVETGMVSTSIASLRQHLPWILAQTWLPYFEEELRACRRVLASAVGGDTGPTPAGICPYCESILYTDFSAEVRRLRRTGKPFDVDEIHAGKHRSDRVVCGACRASWTGAVEMARLNVITHGRGTKPRVRSGIAGSGGRA